MRKIILTMSAVVGMFYLSSCGDSSTNTESKDAESTEQSAGGGQASVKDDESANDIVKVAVGSKDHSTLVAAVKAAELVDILSNAGPFTVFAPVNSAFDALPAGTVDGLLQPDKKADLQNVLQYHVAVAVYNPTMFQDGQKIEMVNGGIAIISIKDGKTFINDAELLGNVKASNGIVYVINKVLLPQ
jgi:uncharacterized surface protein with fasciclin (FAS1) repeats